MLRLTTIIVICLTAGAHAATDLRFCFGAPLSGYTFVSPDDAYTLDRGYGFDLGSKWTGGKTFFFSTVLSPGEYKVTVTLGDPKAETIATVKSETRRLMLQSVHVLAGQTKDFTFFVHIRVPQIPGGGQVSLKPRERDPILFLQWDEKTQLTFKELDWDEKLTLEFSDKNPALRSIEITDAVNPITVYLIGDSTMTDQMMEPWAAWGQMLPRFFSPPVVIANYAESGETTASFIGEHRWPKLLSEIHPGDYVLMQFGINDQRMTVDRFKQYFIQFIDDTRKHGATPVLVTSQNLRKLDANGKAVQTLRDFPEAMHQAAKDQNVALIDLNAMSMRLYEALGPTDLPKIFVDGTHQNDYGAYELAKCVVDGIVANQLPFAEYVVSDWTAFDPAHPDSIDAFDLPPDPQIDPARPGGPGAPNGQGPMAGAAPRNRVMTSRPATAP
ncbi:MAG TPA: rhamnogalacturonan acetylesterase [Tepidisphaeraceae bacterium]|jgi:lysophospholipase L1-like esterase|nr:rhamnogalacturonan acetylesterase [Tepidisphaeraceae bacterium]